MLLLTSLLMSCDSSGERELSSYINKIKTRPSRRIEPLPEFTPLPKFVYPENDARRGPFTPRVVQQVDTFTPNTNRPKQALEAFPLEALKYVGILKEGSIVWGLIKEPKGLVTRVKRGDYMGQNFGQVISIQDKYIKLEEAIQVAGKWEKRQVTMNLTTPEK